MPTSRSQPSRSTRERILDAAEERMRTIGLARATTKEIARVAGCSEAALYKHFSGKEEIFVHVLKERLPPLSPLLDELNAGRGGEGSPDAPTVEQNLTEIARRAARFYEQTQSLLDEDRFVDPLRERGTVQSLRDHDLDRRWRAGRKAWQQALQDEEHRTESKEVEERAHRVHRPGRYQMGELHARSCCVRAQRASQQPAHSSGTESGLPQSSGGAPRELPASQAMEEPDSTSTAYTSSRTISRSAGTLTISKRVSSFFATVWIERPPTCRLVTRLVVRAGTCWRVG
jgi:AcrR family transcriptional regulator